MNVSKIGLILLMSTATTTLPFSFASTSGSYSREGIPTKDEVASEESAHIHVGDVIAIPVGPIKRHFAYADRVNCKYEVANPQKVYFAADPEEETNILGLVEDPWIYASSKAGLTAVFQAVALKPGTVTVKFNRVPNLGACSCVFGKDLGRKEPENKGFFSDDKPKTECENSCKALTEKETHKDFKIVTITVLPAE